MINIGSVDGIQVPGFETYAYSASKAAVHQLTRHLAKHLAPDDHRERHRARAVPVAHDAGHPRGGRRRDGEDDAAQAHRPARGHGRPRHLPVVEGRRLHDRHDRPGRRRHRDDEVADAPVPVEPPPTRWRFPPVDVADEHGVVARRRRPRARHAARRLPAGAVPDAARPRRPDGAGGRPTRAASSRSTALHVSRSLRRSMPALRGPRRHRVRRRGRRRAPTRAGPAAGSPTTIRAAYVRAARARLGAQRRGVGRRRAGRRALRRGDRRAVRRRVDVPPPHRRIEGGARRRSSSCSRADGDDRRLLDVQWATAHLASLGAVEVPRPSYLARLARGARRCRCRPWAVDPWICGRRRPPVGGAPADLGPPGGSADGAERGLDGGRSAVGTGARGAHAPPAVPVGSTAAASRSVRSWFASQRSYTERTMAIWPASSHPLAAAAEASRSDSASSVAPSSRSRIAGSVACSPAWDVRRITQAVHAPSGPDPARGCARWSDSACPDHRRDRGSGARHPAAGHDVHHPGHAARGLSVLAGAGDHGAHDRGAPGAAGSPVDDPHVLRALHGQGQQRALPVQPGQGADRPVHRLRPPHPDRATTPTTSSPAARWARSACPWPTSAT